MAPRDRPRVSHVRTGCMTCKRRRVKCSEERPHCSRCLRGGFICAGYAVPKAWIFTGSTEADTQATVSEASFGPCDPASSLISSVQTRRPSADDQQLSLTPVHSPLQLGNSDPFDAQAITIGPHESNLLKIYREFAVQALGKASWWKVNNLEAVQVTCLEEKAAAYALLARNSAMYDVRCRGYNAEPSTSHLSYLTAAQAELRKNLSLVTGSKTSSMLNRVMWTTCFLAFAELIVESPTASVHVRAMSELVVRYADFMGDEVNMGDIIGVSIIDVVRAYITLTRPTIDMVNWFRSIFQTMWDQTGVCRSGLEVKHAISSVVHRDIKDKRLRAIVLDQREEQEKHHELLEDASYPEEATVRGYAVHSRQLFQQVQLLHIALDSMERLRTGRISAEHLQDQVARAYESMSVLLWLIITSPITFTAERLLDGAGKILQHVRGIMTKYEGDETALRRAQRYREARLWTLCVGVHAELYRKEKSELDLACREWFFEALRAEVKEMRIRSWQQLASISEQFLCLDRIKPHISQWWDQVVADKKHEGSEKKLENKSSLPVRA